MDLRQVSQICLPRLWDILQLTRLRVSLRESRTLGMGSGCQDHPWHLLYLKTIEGVTCPWWGRGWGPGFLTLSPPPPLPLPEFMIPTAWCVFECSCMGPGPRPSACSPLHGFLFRLAEHPAGMRRGLSCSCPTSSSWALWRAGFSRPPATWGSCLPGRCSMGSPLLCTSF